MNLECSVTTKETPRKRHIVLLSSSSHFSCVPYLLPLKPTLVCLTIERSWSLHAQSTSPPPGLTRYPAIADHLVSTPPRHFGGISQQESLEFSRESQMPMMVSPTFPFARSHLFPTSNDTLHYKKSGAFCGVIRHQTIMLFMIWNIHAV